MTETLEQAGITEIRVGGNSWVIELPNEFAAKNGLPAKTQVLLTFKDDKVSAEILPPLSEKLASVADQVLTKRARVFEELQRLGD